jgi:hypothetical protein
MPKIVGTRERVHQPFYDSLIRVDGSTQLGTSPQNGFGAIGARTQLFSRQASDIAITNLATPGQFTSDQTFVTLAIRVWTYFRVNFEAQVTQNQLPVRALDADSMTDRVARVHKLYHQSQNQLFFDFTAGDKPQIQHFTAYTPFAGGLDGFFADSRLPRANNGVPTSSALMRLARPILIPPRQGFRVFATISPIGDQVGASLVEQLNGLISDPSVAAFPGPGTLTVKGADNIEKDIKYLIDGIHSRDVL